MCLVWINVLTMAIVIKAAKVRLFRICCQPFVTVSSATASKKASFTVYFPNT